MDSLKTTANLVKIILINDKQARNSDNYLYFKVCDHISKEKGIDIASMHFSDVLLHLRALNLPQFETVRRTRQKVQHDYPELAACGEVETQRIMNEETYRNYARGE